MPSSASRYGGAGGRFFFAAAAAAVLWGAAAPAALAAGETVVDPSAPAPMEELVPPGEAGGRDADIDEAPIPMEELVPLEELGDVSDEAAMEELVPAEYREEAAAAAEVPNPHWRPGMCGECHVGTPVEGSRPRFRTDDMIALCERCHYDISAHAYIHATGMVPSRQKYERMPAEFRDALKRGSPEGKLSCIVCHNLVYQCLEKEYSRKILDPMFFRGGPYNGRTDICYKCHDPKNYTRLDPHDMISDEGEILTTKCVVCHSVVPDVKHAEGIGDVSFKVTENLERLCRRCHYGMANHPGTFIAAFGATKKSRRKRKEPFTHLRVPPKKVLERLEKTTAEKGIVMPLEPGTGKIFCAPCHNPHERGVQRLARADRGADNVQRLRAGRKGEVCLMCHDK